MGNVKFKPELIMKWILVVALLAFASSEEIQEEEKKEKVAHLMPTDWPSHDSTDNDMIYPPTDEPDYFTDYPDYHTEGPDYYHTDEPDYFTDEPDYFTDEPDQWTTDSPIGPPHPEVPDMGCMILPVLRVMMTEVATDARLIRSAPARVVKFVVMRRMKALVESMKQIRDMVQAHVGVPAVGVPGFPGHPGIMPIREMIAKRNIHGIIDHIHFLMSHPDILIHMMDYHIAEMEEMARHFGRMPPLFLRHIVSSFVTTDMMIHLGRVAETVAEEYDCLPGPRPTWRPRPRPTGRPRPRPTGGPRPRPTGRPWPRPTGGPRPRPTGRPRPRPTAREDQDLDLQEDQDQDQQEDQDQDQQEDQDQDPHGDRDLQLQDYHQNQRENPNLPVNQDHPKVLDHPKVPDHPKVQDHLADPNQPGFLAQNPAAAQSPARCLNPPNQLKRQPLQYE